MKKIKDNNSGFTLIELIIAIAVLAFLMIAVSSLMTTSVITNRKANAEVKVHTKAQETYNQVTDSVMQAKEIVVVAYKSSTEISFDKQGEDTSATLETVVFVKDDVMKKYILDNPEVYGITVSDPNSIKYFTDYDASSHYYLRKLVILTAEQIDVSCVPGVSPGATSFTKDDALTLADDDVTIKNVNATDPTAPVVFNTSDNVINTYTFIDGKMYYEKKYSFMTSKNDLMDNTSEKTRMANLYNDSLAYAVSGSGSSAVNVTGCMVTFDAEKGALGIDFKFNDLNMTYNTKGMINTRNSYVLKAKDN